MGEDAPITKTLTEFHVRRTLGSEDAPGLYKTIISVPDQT
jgi:hypothetical protein